MFPCSIEGVYSPSISYHWQIQVMFQPGLVVSASWKVFAKNQRRGVFLPRERKQTPKLAGSLLTQADINFIQPQILPWEGLIFHLFPILDPGNIYLEADFVFMLQGVNRPAIGEWDMMACVSLLHNSLSFQIRKLFDVLDPMRSANAIRTSLESLQGVDILGHQEPDGRRFFLWCS